MDDEAVLARRFEEQRPRLRSVAYRMLGSAAEADDAVQEAWLRLSRSDVGGIESLPAWLTTVVARLCLSALRTRGTRGEVPLDGALPEAGEEAGADPEREAVLAESVGLAMLVVLDTLAPAERVAFVLHDMFAVPFDEIARMTERTPAAARQLASRARRRVRGASPAPDDAERDEQRRLVAAFLAASRDGDLDALVAVLDPDVVLHADRAAGPTPESVDVRGRLRVAHGASAAAARVAFTEPALVDGSVGLVMAPAGRLRLVLAFTFADGVISGIDVVADPERLRGVRIEVL
ncbi:sigma-70 family RNA polymerase sigma factor [Actinacidiphila paucisporea]|uniref:RNA polymerase sigma-70 factor, ECF subfamily n=1 Tax=Actinacidiphila paucisporea TaxID=310782 RepID=A0A1M7PBG5_9ACTN|nr:sigma-70 family RNA polymerase sigma factor [Actinacidiphila paucisporea]SHN14182.1 RNA polymerase sigma-70 factor, ECF subfamily [Actinacidiphila paucisporea]